MQILNLPVWVVELVPPRDRAVYCLLIPSCWKRWLFGLCPDRCGILILQWQQQRDLASPHCVCLHSLPHTSRWHLLVSRVSTLSSHERKG